MSTRKAIRDAAKTVLQAEFSEWPSSRITGARGYDYDSSSLPAVQVSTPSQDVTHESKDGVLFVETELELSFLTTGSASSDVEDDLEGFSDRALQALLSSTSFMSAGDEILKEKYRFTRGELGEKAPARLDMTLSLFTVMEA